MPQCVLKHFTMTFFHCSNFSGTFKVGDLVTSIGRLWPWSRLFVADQVDLVRVGGFCLSKF